MRFPEGSDSLLMSLICFLGYIGLVVCISNLSAVSFRQQFGVSASDGVFATEINQPDKVVVLKHL